MHALAKELGYWEKRYVDTIHEGEDELRGPIFDWLCSYEGLRPRLDALGLDGARVLDLGCGNSQLPEDLATSGSFASVDAVDFSPVVVDAMRERAANRGLQARTLSNARFSFRRSTSPSSRPPPSSALCIFSAPAPSKAVLRYDVMDARALSFPTGSFDLVLDKGASNVAHSADGRGPTEARIRPVPPAVFPPQAAWTRP